MSMTDEEFYDYIMSGPTLEELDTLHGGDGYDACGRLATKYVYEHLKEYPQDNQYDEFLLYNRVQETHPHLIELGLTGFMWGYAMQSAEHLLGLELKPNPALLTLSIPD